MIEEQVTDKIDIVWKYIFDHPGEKITVSKLSKELKIPYSTVNSYLYRFHLMGKIKKLERGIYTLVELPRSHENVDQFGIHRIVCSEDVEERREAVKELKNNFLYFIDKKQAWDDLQWLIQDNNDDVRRSAIRALGGCYSHLPDEYKKQAWDDLHRFTQDNNDDVRRGAADALGGCYSHVPDEYKKQAWDDLHRFTQDNNDDVRGGAIRALGGCYSHIPDEYKKQAWDDLHRFTQDNNDIVRRGAADALGGCYSQIPDEYKKQAWDDLRRFTQDNNYDVRRSAIRALGGCYSHVPDEYKKQAWDDLHRFTQDNDDDVRSGAARALGGCYSHVPDECKKQAWDDLHRFTQDNNDDVRSGAVRALGSCYSHLPDEYKKQAWDDLHRLTQDKDTDVRVAANYSSGRVSIYRASRTKGDELVKKELETALRFFEKASNESTYSNPAKFCLPFYRSFYAITFRKENAEDEVKQYLTEAKGAVEGSKSKEKLLEAMENLGNALKEAQRAQDFDAIKSDLNTYRRYCDRACELLDATEEKAPGASGLIRKGLPIIDERIKGIIAQIREKAKALCKQVKDTEYKEIGRQANTVGQELSKAIDPIRLEKEVSRMLIPLSAICQKMPDEDKKDACEILKLINDEQNIEDKLPLISMFLSKISTQMIKKREGTGGFNNEL